MDPGFDIVDVLRAALRRENETSTVEFKEYVDPDNEKTLHWLLRAIAAMANGETDGFVFVGVKDEGPEVVGLSEEILAKFDSANVYKKVSAFLAPTPRLDVHRLSYDEKRLVGIVVHPFEEVPTFVSQSFDHYSAGTILVRTAGGESSPAAKDADIRALCDRIVAKHAETVVGYMQRYTRLAASATTADQEKPEQDALRRARALAQDYWEPGRRYIEVFFAPCGRLDLGLECFRQFFPWSFVPTRFHGFPTTQVRGWHGPRLRPQGWIATIPDKPEPGSPVVPEYLWAMHVSWAFLDRDRFWEDDGKPRIVGGIGVMHLATRVCLLLRLLRRIARCYGLAGDDQFLVGTRLSGVKGRYLASEYASDTKTIPRAEEDDVEVSRIITLSELDEFPKEGLPVPAVVLGIMEEAGWRLGRTDIHLDTYIRAIKHAADSVEAAILFPREEDVSVYRQGGPAG